MILKKAIANLLGSCNRDWYLKLSVFGSSLNARQHHKPEYHLRVTIAL